VTKVEFHIIGPSLNVSRECVLDRLLSSEIAAGNAIHIHASNSSGKAALLKRYEQYLHNGKSLTICHITEPQSSTQVLFNLAPDVPHFFSRMKRTVEIIDVDDNRRALGRERYQFYRDRGYPLQHRQLTNLPPQTPVQYSLA